MLAPSISDKPIIGTEIIIAGEFSQASGLGEGARIMEQVLRNHNISTYILEISPYHFSFARYQEAVRLLTSYPSAPLILHMNAPQIPFALLNLPRKLLRNRKIIGYWAWELPVLPEEWKVGFWFVHEIWVPSYFVAQAVKQEADIHGKTVRVIPHPIAAQPEPDYASISRTINREHLNLPLDKLLVLTSFNLASSFARKNPIGAIQAFKRFLSKNSAANIHMILKITHPSHYHEDMRKIIEAVDGNAKITIKTDTLSFEENRALLFHADIVLSLHRSEGFGLVPAEAMKLGKGVIATDWSATREFVKKKCGIPIDYSLIPVNDTRMVYQVKNAFWADPDIDMAAQGIQDLFENPDLRRELGACAQKEIQRKFGAETLIRGLSAAGFSPVTIK